MIEQPLNASPIQIESHEFLEISVRASEQEAPVGDLSLKINRKWALADKDTRRWKLILTIFFGGERDGKESTYTGMLKIGGSFIVAEKYPQEKASDLIQITGASILYGACREMLANLTARCPRGMVSLPSVSFVPLPSEAEVPNSGAQRISRKKRQAVTKPGHT
jgi:preprotein translocase subunit SecB